MDSTHPTNIHAEPYNLALPTRQAQQPSSASSSPFSILRDENQIVQVVLDSQAPTPQPMLRRKTEEIHETPVAEPLAGGLPVYRPPSTFLARLNPSVLQNKFNPDFHSVETKKTSVKTSGTSGGSTPRVAKATGGKIGRPKKVKATTSTAPTEKSRSNGTAKATIPVLLEPPKNPKKRNRAPDTVVEELSKDILEDPPSAKRETRQPATEQSAISSARTKMSAVQAKRSRNGPITKEIGGQIMPSSSMKATAAAAVREARETQLASVSPSPPRTASPPPMPLAAVQTPASRLRALSGRSQPRRPTLEDRIKYLNPPLIPEPEIVKPRVVVLPSDETQTALTVAKNLVEELLSVGIRAKVPKAEVVAVPAETRYTHVIAPPRTTRLLYVTCAISNGLWRVPYEWAHTAIRMRTEAGQKALTPDERSFVSSYRSPHLLFQGKSSIVLISEERRKLQIEAVLENCGASETLELSEADIVVTDNDAVPLEPAERHWIWEDFEVLFKSATL